MLILKLPEDVVLHEDMIDAIYAQDWVKVKECVLFLKIQNQLDILHWMIQRKEVAVEDVFHLMDEATIPVSCSLYPTKVTLLQRAVANNRIEVIQGLIQRGHPLYHDMECAITFHPLLLALHPLVDMATFECLISYYSLPPKNAFAKYSDAEDRLLFYVPVTFDRMKAMEEAGADMLASHFDFLCGDAQAMAACGASLVGTNHLTAYLFHYLAVHQIEVCRFVAKQFLLPFLHPTLAAAVLRSNDAELVHSLVTILSLADPIVTEGKSAMLYAAEQNADQSCTALMEAGVEGELELERTSFFQLSRTPTAYLTALLRGNQALAKTLLDYNQNRKKKSLLLSS